MGIPPGQTKYDGTTDEKTIDDAIQGDIKNITDPSSLIKES